jgi:hypothetical protein
MSFPFAEPTVRLGFACHRVRLSVDVGKARFSSRRARNSPPSAEPSVWTPFDLARKAWDSVNAGSAQTCVSLSMAFCVWNRVGKTV